MSDYVRMGSTAVRYLAAAAGWLYCGCRAVFRVVMRALLAGIDRNRAGRGVGPMGPSERRQARAVIAVGFALPVLVMWALLDPPPHAAATPPKASYPTATRTAPTSTPARAPAQVTAAPRTSAAAPPPVVVVPDVDVDRHVNLPDGALTGGYCRRKWWC